MSEATPAAAAAPAPAAVAPAAAAAPAPAAAAANGTTPNPPAEQPGHKVFAGNLSYATTDEGLKAFFAPVASDILSTQIILRGPRSAGYGFVAFSTLEAANKAVTLLNKQELDGRPVIVELAKPAEEKEKDKEATGGKKKSKSKKGKSKIKAAAAAAVEAVVPGATTTTEATDKPATTEDKPKKKRNSRKTKKAAATPNGEEAAAAPAATDAKPAEPKEKKEKVKKPKVVKPKRPVGEAPEGQPSKTMLFVANLGFSVNDAALAEIFTSAGIPVTSARVVCRRWGTPRRSKGYGFVSTDTEENQKKALELLQGKEIDGRAIAVKIAVDSPETKEELAAEKELSTPQAAPVAAPTAA